MLNDLPASPSAWLKEERTVGMRIGGARYILKRKIGLGGCTEVWLARDVKWEKDIALKFLPGKFIENGSLLDQLDTEVRRSAQLAHPGIARVFHLLWEREVAAIVTEYVDGWPLAALKLDRPGNRFPIDDINLWLHQLCAALDYAHHHFCLVHRDLNPCNLLLNAREYLKVTDFAIDHAIRNAAAHAMNLIYGSIFYLSPQQLRGAEASVLDDIYSLGATMFDLVTGTPPFYQGDVRSQIVESTPPSMRERLRETGAESQVPVAWEEVIGACLSKAPGKRPQSASELLRGIEIRTMVNIEVPTQKRPLFRNVLRQFWGSTWRWVLEASQRCSRRISPMKPVIDFFRKNPRLLLLAFLSLAAMNLGIALWFLFRR